MDDRTAELSNRRIFRRIIPYLAIFVVTFSIAGFQLFQDIAGSAEAGDDYTVDIRAVNTPLTTTDEWEWSVAVVNDRPEEVPELGYKVNWCSFTEGGYAEVLDESCGNKDDIDFLYDVSDGTLNTRAPESIHTLKHQSVSCGRIELEIMQGEEIIKTHILDTGKECTTTSYSAGFGGNVDSSEDPIDFINEVYCDLFECEGAVDEGEVARQNDPGDPNNPDPIDPGQSNPPPPKSNDSGLTLSCPIPSGNTFVGSFWTPVNGYGHCDAAYNSSASRYQNCRGGRDVIWGTAYGIDVRASAGQNLFLPTINGETVTWNHYNERPSAVSPGQSIHRYSTTYNGERIALQYHHAGTGTQPPVGANIQSGSIGTTTCTNGCDHVHIQLRLGSKASGQNSQGWVDAGAYFNCLNL